MKDLNDLFGGADIMGMVGKLREDMQKAQAELETVEVEGVSGGGLVRIKASAKGRILGLSIDDSLVVPADKTMLEDLIVAAYNDAEGQGGRSGRLSHGQGDNGLPIPPGFKMPF